MPGRKRAYRRWSIQRKLIFFFFVVVLVPLGVLGTISYSRSTEALNSQFGRYGDYAAQQLKLSLDNRFKDMEFIAGDVIYYLMNPLYSWYDEPDSYEGMLQQRTLERFLGAHLTSQISGLYVITGDHLIGASPNTLNTTRLLQSEWWKRTKAKSGEKYWSAFHESFWYGSRESDRNDISLMIPLRETFNVPKDTRIWVNMKADGILRLISAFEKETDALVELTDRNGAVLYRTPHTQHPPKDDDVRWTETLETSGWNVDIRIPYEVFYRSSFAIRTSTLIVGLLSIVIAMFLALWFSSTITRPIRRLITSMNQVSVGNLSARVEVRNQDELGRLAQRFNYMTSRIGHLMRENARLEVKKTEAELRMLHYQINPHLMFNTLNSIQWKAKLGQGEDVAKMIFHLTRVLEESLDSAGGEVPLRRELETVRHYLEIQKYRFGAAFRYEEQVDEGMKDCLIPRMVLQPLFENIFYHAFTDGCGNILLKAYDDNGTAVLELSDDGSGIPAEAMPRLVEPSPSRKGRGGVGVYNVHEKFRLFYGSPYGLRYESEPGKGTTLTIRWPYKEE